MLSVLVPAYNAEVKIEKCLQALLNQSCHDFELIICDDGSKDNTYKIVDDFLPKFNNAKLLTQDNKGVGETRTRLVEEATGEYIIFCDADDFLCENTIQNVYAIIDRIDADLYVWGYNLVKEYGSKSVKKRCLSEGIYTKEKWGKHHCNRLGDLYYSSVWNKCYKKAIVLQTPKINFYPMIEDVIFNVEYIRRCSKVYIRENIDYNYVQIGLSLTRNKKRHTRETAQNVMKAYDYLNRALKETYPNQNSARKKFIFLKLLSLKNVLIEEKEMAMADEITQSELWYESKKDLGVRKLFCYLDKPIRVFNKWIKSKLRKH